mmetsp:Transcript_13110/g.19289  ORF Transcript_13110/g.19289 Transcript_13110/m.19289 type:complete len:83 (-) Transcript_13110:1020-1268(-)
MHKTAKNVSEEVYFRKQEAIKLLWNALRPIFLHICKVVYQIGHLSDASIVGVSFPVFIMIYFDSILSMVPFTNSLALGKPSF